MNHARKPVPRRDDRSRARAPADPEALLTEGQTARLLGLKPRTLQAWRLSGRADLPFVRISRRAVRYRRADVRRFVDRHLRRSTSDPGGKR